MLKPSILFPGSDLLKRLPGTKALELTQHYRQRTGAVDAPSDARNPATRLWILSRSQYRVRPERFSHVPKGRRSAAIQLALAAWAPWPRTTHWVIPNGTDGNVLLIAWDQSATEALQQEAGVADLALVTLPEDALRPLDSTVKGVQVLDCIDGTEARFAIDGNITHTQWWPSRPEVPEWSNFLRGASVPVDQRTVQPSAPTGRPWISKVLGHPGSQNNEVSSASERLQLAVAAVLLTLPTIWLAGDYTRYALAERSALARATSAAEANQATLDARNSALNALGRVEYLGRVFSAPDVLAIFAEVSRRIGSISKYGTLQLVEWDLRRDGPEERGRRLRFALVANSTPPSGTALVKAFDASPMFREVQIKVDGGRLNVELRVLAPDGSGAVMPPAPQEGKRL